MQVTSTAHEFLSLCAKRKLVIVKAHGRGEDPLTHYYAFAGSDLMGYLAEDGDYAPGDICDTKQESRQMECDVCHPRRA